jgi:hypothetical protein
VDADLAVNPSGRWLTGPIFRFHSRDPKRTAMALQFLSPLHKASRQLSVYLEAHTRELGVSPSEGHLISYLRSYAPAPVGELVRVFGM